LNPLSALYGAGIDLRNHLYDRGTLHARRLQAPVVSIGSISAGGAGKTPFLILLGGLLKQRGIAFDVLSRGYGRRTKGVALVDPKGSPQEFGDEPLLIARKLGVPVIVGEDRYAAGRFAEEKFGPQVHLLDDGFQHRRLARDFDIALVTNQDLQDSLLPVGKLREPLSSLSRATAIVLMDGVASDRVPVVEGQQMWRVSRSVVPPETRDECFAFCGIARPQNFFTELRNAGVSLAGTREFRDHRAYSAADIQLLLRLRQQSGATAFVTTEKDAVNLGSHLPQLQPIHVTPMRMQFEPLPERVDASVSLLEQLHGLIARQNQSRVRE
jgi:tetraacyldisaccharide 4'-kinase